MCCIGGATILFVFVSPRSAVLNYYANREVLRVIDARQSVLEATQVRREEHHPSLASFVLATVLAILGERKTTESRLQRESTSLFA